ncbi:MAG: hypothetical protein H6Q05_4664, partial [Acidobacteria bacterium]|nr:hypothetical protein [Acidobacteriota bacterium]
YRYKCARSWTEAGVRGPYSSWSQWGRKSTLKGDGVAGVALLHRFSKHCEQAETRQERAKWKGVFPSLLTRQEQA